MCIQQEIMEEHLMYMVIHANQFKISKVKMKNPYKQKRKFSNYLAKILSLILKNFLPLSSK